MDPLELRNDYLDVADVAAALLTEPAVAAAWEEHSALAEYTVGGLAGHYAGQIFFIGRVLQEPPPKEEPIPLLDYYSRVSWLNEPGLDSPANVRIRAASQELAAAGPQSLSERAAWAVGQLRTALPDLPPRNVRLPNWHDWSLTFDDFLTTRLFELVIHTDDLAVSVGLPTPELPDGAVDTVVALLAQLAVRRHGATDVIRALSRAERAPTKPIAAI
ncbi:maleylpyruvate isomerase N-terminal domain-containing protein [Actinomadura barringtoniae]|uniref:Maleylpyruvate isomerase N-terminal domain-containing protein n=1 Tax=Actinomadura barringtoniae TaxID=1427535 RepID=A0A939PFA6_9ACTN|nr:maleylpyruvate isomerase N-terminal domain-containing protein [Actinomadura barringtoniae]MBO2449058.1 maleylpyruvate isomerase N-terminal domain-containing protein [Actinomadura barringtoniae]